MVKHYIKLDLSKRDERKIIPVSKSDTNTHKIIFTLTNGSEPIILPADVDAWVNVRNTASPIEKAAVNHADNTIEYTPSSDAFKATGFVVSVLTISDTANRTLFSPTFYFYVEDIGSDITTVFNQAATTSAAGRNIAAIMTAALDTLGTAKDDVQKHAENAEAWATGAVTVDKESVPVGKDKEQYNNNAKYYAEQANISAQTAQSYAQTAQSSANDFEKFASSASNAAKTATEAKDATLAAVKNFTENLNPSSVSIELDHETYELTFKLLSSKGETLSQQLIDLPLESCVVGFDDFVDDNGKHYLRLKLRSGAETDIELDAIFANIQQKLNAKQNKLPINNSGSSSRVWVATNNHYKVKSTDGGAALTKCGRQIGVVTFNQPVTLEELETYTIDGYSYTEYSPRITTKDFTLKDDKKSVSSAMKYAAILARVSELYMMTGDDGETPFAYKDYIRATGSGTKTITFYWTYPYYFRRVLAASNMTPAETAKNGGPVVGFVTLDNYFNKWYNKEINSVATPTLAQYRDYLISRYMVDVVNRESDDSALKEVTAYTNYALFHKQNTNGTYASNNPDTGFYYSLFNVQDNEEPFSETIAVRDAYGRLVVEDVIGEDDTQPLDYHAVNNKHLEKRLSKEIGKIDERLAEEKVETDKKIDEVSTQFDAKLTEEKTKIDAQIYEISPILHYDYHPTEAQRAKKDMRGWYRIAEASRISDIDGETEVGGGFFSNIFHINVQVWRSAFESDVVFTAERQSYSSGASLGVLSFASKNGRDDVIDKMRIVYYDAYSGEPGTANLKAYLEVHMNQNSTAEDAWDERSYDNTFYRFTTETLFRHKYCWKLITPQLVSAAIETDWASHTIDPRERAWSRVATDVSDINQLPERITSYYNTCVGLTQTIKAQAAQIEALEKFHNQSAQIVYPTEEQRANQDMTGWYRIAETSSAKGLFSDVFHLRTIVLRSNYSSDVVFTAERMNYMSDPSISVLSFASAGGVDVIDKLRVVYVKNSTTEKTYLEVHINKNSPYSDAWEVGTSSTGCTFYVSSLMGTPYKWNIITPTLVSSELGANWTSYEKSPIDHAWNKVTATVDDINKASKIGELTAKTDDLQTIVDLMHPTGEVLFSALDSVDESNKTIGDSFIANALYYNVVLSMSWAFTNPFDERFHPLTDDDIYAKFKFVPDFVGSSTGNVLGFTLEVGEYAVDRYQINSCSASRGSISSTPLADDDYWWYDITIAIQAALNITIFDEDNPDGLEVAFEGTLLGCLNADDPGMKSYSTAILLKNEYTEVLFPSTYDLRTQSIDSQLRAAIEEARARREETRAIGETE